jgi:hypothetical protein
MGRQIVFHMRPEDCEAFLSFVQDRDSVVLTPFIEDSTQVRPLDRTNCYGKWLCLWNQSLLPYLDRKQVRDVSPTCRVEDSLPVLQLSLPSPIEWAGRPAALQGRLYAYSYHVHPDLRTWYEALARWIRRRFVRNPIAWMGGYVGPDAYEWHKAGGLFLPFVPPAVNAESLERILSQHHRAE